MPAPYFVPTPLKNLMLAKGEAGQKWLDNLPGTVAKLEKEWRIIVDETFAECYCNYVAPAKTAEGKSVVLKLSFPNKEFYRELKYLQLQQGGPVPQLLHVDESIPAMLMEKMEPAEMLVKLDDTEAIPITAQLLTELWKVTPPTEGFETMDDIFADFLRLKTKFAGQSTLAPEIIEKAEQSFRTLLTSPQEQVLLHGDLHQFNIISDEQKGWIVIDPAGAIGERAYDVSAFLKNPPEVVGHSPRLKEILINRIQTFAQLLNLDSKRLYLAGLFSTVLSVWWAMEDGSEIGDDFIKVAEALASIMI
jgi:streptomycin 6-kinase